MLPTFTPITTPAIDAHPIPTAASDRAQAAKAVDKLPIDADQDELNRILVAAVINQRFCARLLANPKTAIQAGYRGERFAISSQLLTLLDAIRVETLSEFAQMLHANLDSHSQTDSAK